MITSAGQNKELRPGAANKQVSKPEPVECHCGTVYQPTKKHPACPQCYRKPRSK